MSSVETADTILPYRQYVADMLALIDRRLSPEHPFVGGDDSFDEPYETLRSAVGPADARAFRAAVDGLLTMSGIGVEAEPGDPPVADQMESLVLAAAAQ